MTIKKYAILGLGRSGLATAKALMHDGAQVILWDDNPHGRQAAIEQGFTVTPLNRASMADCQALVVSPGIPLLYPEPHPVIIEAKSIPIPITGDLDIFFTRHPTSTFVGITGTNGKSTTTALIGHILKESGKKVSVGGNIGVPVLSLAGETNDHKVLEVSSYQLDINPRMSFKVALLLNITPDHLDRHGSFENYVATKKKIFQHQTPQDVAIIGVDDPSTQHIARELQAHKNQRVITFSIEHVLPHAYFTMDGIFYDDTEGKHEKIYDLNTHPRLKGVHNWQNIVAGFLAAQELGIARADILKAITTFPGLAHRQEYVANLGSIDFINDSKATNGEATAKALACFKNIYWIVGGQPKQDGLTATRSSFGQIKHAFLIGVAAASFAEELKGKLPFTMAETLDRAITLAHAQAIKDGLSHATILLSPACASFDQFKDYEDRGNVFKNLVHDLVKPNAKAH